jgi:hypothetical protein
VGEMAQTELQKEFNDLVKSISDEVLELTVSKSINNATHVFENKVPELNRHLNDLRVVLDSLKQVSKSIADYEAGQKIRDNVIYEKFDSVQRKIDDRSESIIKKIGENTSLLNNNSRTSVNKLESMNQSLKEEIRTTNKVLQSELNTLATDEKAFANTTRKLVISTLVFSIGSFGVLVTLLLKTLGIISL